MFHFIVWHVQIFYKNSNSHNFLGLSKGVGFIRFDQRHEADRAIKELNGTIPKNATDPITVKFANNPSSSKALAPLAAYITPQNPRARGFPGGAAAAAAAAAIHHPSAAGRYRYVIKKDYKTFFSITFL